MLRAVAVLALVVTATSSQPPPPAPAKAGQEHQNQATPESSKPGANQQTTNTAPPAVAQPRTVATTGNQGYRGSVKKGHPATDWGFIWSVINTGLLTLFSGALAWLAHRQHQAMRTQAVYMRGALRETKRAADAAKDGAKAATSAAETAKRSLEMTERPEVLVTGVNLEKGTFTTEDQLGDAPVIDLATALTIVVTNYGRTTARELHVAVDVGSSAPDAQVKLFGVVELPYVLGAGVPYEFSLRPLGRFFNQDVLNQIMEGITEFYVEAQITYDDDFNDRRYSITGTAVYREQTGKFFIIHTAATGKPKHVMHAAAPGPQPD